MACSKPSEKNRPRLDGFTLIELLVGVAILFLVSGLGTVAFRAFQQGITLTNSSEEMLQVLRLAQRKALASEGQSEHGVWFTNATTPHQYTLFRGVSYGSRDPSFDQLYQLPSQVDLYEIDFGGGGEVVFEKVTGTASPPGHASLRLFSNPTNMNAIYVDGTGTTQSNPISPPSDADRVKDSRHVHFDYMGRTIDTAVENMVLTLEATIQTIPIAANMQGGQIFWAGEIDVGGEIQRLFIHTHRLNDVALGTEFCVHRDPRFNTKPLVVELTGDISGNLIQYSAAGATTQGTSVYASAPIWQ